LGGVFNSNSSSAKKIGCIRRNQGFLLCAVV